MIPVDQTRLYDPAPDAMPGNCWAACLASLLELSIEELPDPAKFCEGEKRPHKSWSKYLFATYDWLRERGMAYLEVKVSGIIRDEMGDVNCIIVGPSPRGATLHAVVGCGSKITHDPHPSRAGLSGEEHDWRFGYLIPIDPSGLLK